MMVLSTKPVVDEVVNEGLATLEKVQIKLY